MVKKEANQKILITLGIVGLVLLAANIATFAYFNSKVNSLKAENVALSTQIETVTKEKNDIQSEFTSHKDLVKRYIAISKAIIEDVQQISLTLQEPTSATFASYNSLKKFTDKYDSQLNVFENHLAEVANLLRDNKEFFEELGIDVQKEIDSQDEVLSPYYKILEGLESILEDMK